MKPLPSTSHSREESAFIFVFLASHITAEIQTRLILQNGFTHRMLKVQDAYMYLDFQAFVEDEL